jgi:ribosomal protein L13
MGMLPRNRKRAGMIRRLHLYTGGEHPYAAKLAPPKA